MIVKLYRGLNDEHYPVTKVRLFEDAASVAAMAGYYYQHGTQSDEKYYELVEISKDRMDQIMTAGKEEADKKDRQREITSLKKRLKELGVEK